ncbi:pyridine nucleotide-disulfide oxidoreductase [Treponema phagedenis]|uniref:Pyridine nucleotide-disulfide oxidoreductase n=1 Tax=Treponema phagedenis TaxID=162 RepID=A0A0B7GWH3_TREPH|nr:FAD-dependent oxidoreductase [Treponema phagedenis]EFW37869.1 pyridine nucleotide-disulfide oxidoreductase [Treponema phagedenis F0421]NVP23032.1 FAD-dependent oxidoreductase [Treponema phagedenis]QEJ95152.1 pyridine nucleotide-disulfide oxidoreductase [Treponema phagedenis]QEJ98177.1 pyridine nucleotide-disulfide oxidoreductase [Treponema phagedenis]QEK01076.1 pyridine nucleotide-disulfide oxidoreductase [Treponema phagedenis]
MKHYNCIIVGTGPAGLAAAFALLEKKPAISILLIDKAKISSGGLRNDCKMNFTYPIGFPIEYWNEETANRYLEQTEKFLEPDILPRTNIEVYQKRAERIGVKLLSIRQSHLGTDGGVKLIKELLDRLANAKVEVSLEEALVSIDKQKKIANTSKRTTTYDSLIVAPGRKGFDFLRNFMKANEIPYTDNSIDVGVRVETKIEHYPIVEDYYDPKFLFPEKTRTFCTNSGAASVVQEKYTAANGQTYYSVNGHAYSNKRESNGLVNFAMLRTVNFTQPLASGQDYAEFLASLVMLTGGGHPIMQRIGDFRLGKRSTKEGLNGDLFHFTPSLASCTPGDITLAMPAKFLHSIWKALKKLDNIVPGILHPSTVLYYPEIKLYANKPLFKNNYFMADEDIYLIGDGAGTSRGITGAWASGIRAADGILQKGMA